MALCVAAAASSRPEERASAPCATSSRQSALIGTTRASDQVRPQSWDVQMTASLRRSANPSPGCE